MGYKPHYSGSKGKKKGKRRKYILGNDFWETSELLLHNLLCTLQAFIL